MVGTFYRVYRPQKFKELIGQETIRLILEQSIKENKIAQAYLFTGPRGTGKTTTARIFSKAINCLTPIDEREGVEPCGKCPNCKIIDSGQTLDLMEIDAASYTGVDNIRQITENINLAPSVLKYRVFIIDEVHMLSKGAFNALLKTLEEPPSHTIFILATTEYSKVPPTIASRCQRYFFRLFNSTEIVSKLKKIVKKENIHIGEDELKLIAEASGGGMRDAESLFSQIVSSSGKELKPENVREILGIASQNEELNFVESLVEKKPKLALEIFDRLLSQGVEPFLLSHRVLEILRKALLIKVNPSFLKILEKEIDQNRLAKIKSIADKSTSTSLSNLIMKFIQAQPLIKNSSLPHLPLEIILVEYCLPEEDKEPLIEIPAVTEVKAVPKKVTTKTMDDQEEIKKIEKPILIERKEEKKQSAETDSKTTEKTETVFELKTVIEKWPEILSKMKDLQPALLSILKVCSPVKIESETLVISTPFKFHQEKLNEAKNKNLFCQELKTATGISKICVLEDKCVKVEPKKNEELVDQVRSLLDL